MLKKKYEIHPRPHEFVPILLNQIFGGSHTGKIGSFAVGIAPEDHMCDKDDSSIGSSDSGGKKIKWLPEIDWETKKGGEKKEKGHHSSGSADSIHIPPPQNAEVVSAKATVGLTIDISPATSRHPAASQSPGLVVYPSTFIPMSAEELETHASKHLHVLLGCKYALIEYISDFKDDNGERLVCNQELTDLFWDYECFRRRRFNWPSEPDEMHSFMSDATESEPSSKSANLHTSTDSDTTVFSRPSSGSSVKTSNKRDSSKFEASTHIRTIRVFEAYKSEDDKTNHF